MKIKFISSSLFGKVRQHLLPNFGTILVIATMLFVNNVYASKLNAATSPSTISYQGTLTDAGGMPVNATVGLTVSLYNVQSGGTPLWTEAHTGTNAVPINNGAFNMRLGGITPIPSSVWDNPVVYLGIQVEGDSVELSPREVVDAVPYAMNASGSFTIPDGSVTTAKIADGAVTSEKIAVTYWNLEDRSNNYWTTTLSSQYVNVPVLSFSFTPSKNGVVLLNLSVTFSHSSTSSQLFCALNANGSGLAASNTSALNGLEENCATNIAYPVVAGQSYNFTVGVYSTSAGTLTVHLGSFSHLSAIYLATP